MGAVSPAVASRTLSAPGPLLARTLRTPPAAPGLGAPGSSLLGASSLCVPYPARKWDSNNREGHLQVTYSSFLHVEKACTSPASLIFLSGASVPKVLSDPGTGSLPDSCPWPLLLWGWAAASFPGGREAGQPRVPALRDGACAICNWSCLERNGVNSECFRKEKGFEACRAELRAQGAL